MSKLLTEYDSLINTLLDKSLSNNIYSVIRIQQIKVLSIIYKNKQIDKAVLSSDKGIGMYAFTNSGHMGFGSTNNLDNEQEVVDLLENISKIAVTNKENGFHSAIEIFKLKKQDNLGQDNTHYLSNSVTNINIDKVKELIEELENEILQINSNISLLCRLTVEDEQWRIIRSDGTDVDFSSPKVRLMFSLTLKDDGKTSNTFFKVVTTTLDKIFDKKISEYKEIFIPNIQYLKDQLNAEQIIPGNYPLMIDTELCGMLTHEAFGHACESDAVAEDGSILRGEDGKFRVGQVVAAEGVNIFDYEEEAAHGYHPYGVFGNERKKVQLVENGILKESISDVFTAEKIGVSVKNCERSESYSTVAIPRMSNTYLQLDESKNIEVDKNLDLTIVKDIQTALINNGLLKKYGKILILMKMMGGSVETKLGDFMFGVGFVYEISEDKIKVYKPCSFSGKVLEALKSIEGSIGDLKKDAAGFCGKSGQTVCVNTGGHQFVIFNKSKFVTIS